MKRLAVTAVTALFALAAAAPAYADEASLTLTISDISSPQGDLLISLFAGEAAWNGDGGPAASERLPVDGATETVVFADLAPGEYAIRLYHDVDADGGLNTNPFGIPTEPFAFSNNARGMFGPASYEDAAFVIEAGENTHAVRLQ